MDSFVARLEKSIEYIDMHIEMCTGSLQFMDLEATVAGYEQTFAQLTAALDSDLSLVDKDASNEIKAKTVDLMRDVAICKGLLEKSIQHPGVQRTTAESPFQPLLDRVAELELSINQLEEKINLKLNTPSGLPKENLHGRAAEMYQSLQVQRATKLNSAIEAEMFDL